METTRSNPFKTALAAMLVLAFVAGVGAAAYLAVQRGLVEAPKADVRDMTGGVRRAVQPRLQEPPQAAPAVGAAPAPPETGPEAPALPVAPAFDPHASSEGVNPATGGRMVVGEEVAPAPPAVNPATGGEYAPVAGPLAVGSMATIVSPGTSYDGIQVIILAIDERFGAATVQLPGGARMGVPVEELRW